MTRSLAEVCRSPKNGEKVTVTAVADDADVVREFVSDHTGVHILSELPLDTFQIEMYEEDVRKAKDHGSIKSIGIDREIQFEKGN